MHSSSPGNDVPLIPHGSVTPEAVPPLPPPPVPCAPAVPPVPGPIPLDPPVAVAPDVPPDPGGPPAEPSVGAPPLPWTMAASGVDFGLHSFCSQTRLSPNAAQSLSALHAK